MDQMDDEEQSFGEDLDIFGELSKDISEEQRKRLESYRTSDRKGAPIVEFRHVSIHSVPESEIDDPFELYGYIQVIDGEGDTFDIYKQSESLAVPVCFGDELSLWDLEPIVSPYPVTKIIFNLRDKKNNLELIDDTITLDFMEKMFFGKTREMTIIGKNCALTIRFITFEEAVLAYFYVSLDNKNDKESGDQVVDVFGEVLVLLESKYSFIAPHQPVKLLSTGDCPVKVKLRTSICLKKFFVAVPAYASLKIQASFRGPFTDTTISGTKIIPANHHGCIGAYFKGSNGYYAMVDMIRRPGCPLIEMEKKLTFASNGDDSRAFSIDRHRIERNLEPILSIEVYSIEVILDEKINQFDVLSLYGEISVEYGDRVFHLFQRNESNPESFSKGERRTLALEGPFERGCDDWLVAIDVKLKDVRGMLFCHGYVHYNEQVLYFNSLQISWFKRRICSVIKGVCGLVKVYHSVFEHAVGATVSGLFYFDSISYETDVNVSGRVVARYGNYEYDPYDKEYYQSVLFLKSQESPLKLSGGRKISLPFLKTVVNVPMDTFLTIEVDLSTTLNKSREKVPLQVVAKIEVGVDSCYKLKNEHFSFDLTVGW